MIVVVVIAVGLVVLYLVHAVTNAGTSRLLESRADRRHMNRHGGVVAPRHVSAVSDWSGRQRAGLGVIVETALPAADAFALARSIALQYRGGGPVARWEAFVSLDDQGLNYAVLSLRNQSQLLCQFPMTATSGLDSAPTVLRIGGLTRFGTTQPMFLGFVPSGPRTIHGWDGYREILQRVVEAFGRSDPSSQYVFTDGASQPVQRTSSDATTSEAVGVASSDPMRMCEHDDCMDFGRHTDRLRCRSCHRPTTALADSTVPVNQPWAARSHARPPASSGGLARKSAHAFKRTPDEAYTCEDDSCPQFGLPATAQMCASCGCETIRIDVSAKFDHHPRGNVATGFSSSPPATGDRACPDPACDLGGLRTADATCSQCHAPTVPWT